MGNLNQFEEAKMEEITIEIECLEGRVSDIESNIYSITEYGRNPNSQEYDDMLDALIKRKEIQAQIFTLSEVLSSIESNNA